MADEPAEGGCLCGAVRYRVSGEPVAATLCHCRSCRRASGGVTVAWAVFPKDAFEWLSGSTAEYSSSPGIYWRHCANCGSLVGYRRDSRPNYIDVATATLDEPDNFPPTVEIWTGDKIAWEALHPDLPKKLRSSLNE
jgi:hypothetical protein